MQPIELYQVLEQQYFGESMHERDEIEHLPELLKGVSLFVDVGASLGQYSFFANRTLRNARIYCIEADPVRILRLKELASQWERDSDNKITVIHAAAADKIGKTNFFRTDLNISGGLFIHEPGDLTVPDSLQWTRSDVDCITLDSLLENEEPALIKIDVEGAEYRVLTGARKILEKGKCRFLVEVHPWGDKSCEKMPADIFKLFSHFGYGFRRTHRHWLFEKSHHVVRRFLKGQFIIIVLENAWLKSIAKRCVLAMHALRRKTDVPLDH